MKVINLFESESKIGNTRVIYKGGIVKENLLSSILSDTYTFGVLLLSFWINQQYIHSRIVSTILLLAFLLQCFWGTNKKRVSKDEFLKIMNEHLQESNNDLANNRLQR
jgi:hypothetical protein